MPPGSRVVAAVSGGSDSVALLLLLLDVAGGCGFTVAGVAHVNHGLRGAASDRDEAFCRALAARLGVAFEARHRDVARLAADGRVSIEVAARHARYECLAEMAATLKADTIATGHTRDDQAETFLLRLLRGAGASGLSGIRPRRGRVVRPLLDIRRNELLAELAGRRQAVPHGLDQPGRERAAELGPPPPPADAGAPVERRHRRGAGQRRHRPERRSGAARRSHAGNGEPPDREGQRRRHQPGGPPASRRSHPALARRVVRQALDRLEPSRFRGFDHVEQVLAVARADRGRAAADLPGVRVERNGASVVLYNRASSSRPAPSAFRSELAVPGRTKVPECGCVIEARRKDRAFRELVAKQALGGDRDIAIIDAAAAVAGLAVRSRRPGDWIRPLGLRGRKKLQDVLVNRKVPRHERDRVPLVVDARDRILWVAGHVVSQDARVTDRTRSVVVLKRIHCGEEGDEA